MLLDTSAWAHLILYGEEATKKVAKDGEEAVAAFNQQQKDIAEGKIPFPDPSPPKKKRKPGAPKKKREVTVAEKTAESGGDVESEVDVGTSDATMAEKMATSTAATSPAKRAVPYTSFHLKKKTPTSLHGWNRIKTECAKMLSSGTKGTSKVCVLLMKALVLSIIIMCLSHSTVAVVCLFPTGDIVVNKKRSCNNWQRDSPWEHTRSISYGPKDIPPINCLVWQ